MKSHQRATKSDYGAAGVAFEDGKLSVSEIIFPRVKLFQQPD